jgi:uncharacterized protein CbrC (UPF0167 family)
VGTGSVVASDRACIACKRGRGWIYAGPVYATEELSDCICPWCISDGTAASTFEAMFTDDWGVPRALVEQVTQRTPGFAGWQQEHWMYHCEDACAFLGRVGSTELASHPDALDALGHEHDGLGWTPEQVEDYLASLSRDAPPTAYLFRCRHCQHELAYSDFT